MVLWAEWAWLGSPHLGPLMRLDGRESEWTPGVGDEQGGLAWCDSWGRKDSDTTERLNWTELRRSWSDGPWGGRRLRLQSPAHPRWHLSARGWPLPWCAWAAVHQPSVSVFLPSAPQCGWVDYVAEWWPWGSENDYLVAGSPTASIRETLEGSIRLLETQLQKSGRHFYHIQTIIKRCAFI